MTLGRYYSFDTSAFINGQRDLLPPDVLPKLWPQIASMIMMGEVQAVDVVRDELSQRDDGVFMWAKEQKSLFVPLTVDVQRETRAVLKRYPKLVGVGGGRSGADPFVVALAMANDGTVVTEEHATGNRERPKIPDACAGLGVPCINLLAFIREQGWTFP